MGLIDIVCPICKQTHLWFSGNRDQSCAKCKLNTNDQGRKGYAPREWTVSISVLRGVSPVHPTGVETVILKSAYLALKGENKALIDALNKSTALIKGGESIAVDRITAQLASAQAENIGNLQLIGDLQVEINRLMDTPGGKRIYGALNEITRLNAEIEWLLDSRAKELGQANARIKELSEEIAKMASDSHYVRNSGKRIKELQAESEANFKSAESWKEQALEKFELIDAIEDAKEREQKLVASLENKDEVMESLNLAYAVRIDELKAEIENLLRALEKISELTIWNNQPLEQDFHDANEVALKALKAHRGEGV